MFENRKILIKASEAREAGSNVKSWLLANIIDEIDAKIRNSIAEGKDKALISIIRDCHFGSIDKMDIKREVVRALLDAGYSVDVTKETSTSSSIFLEIKMSWGQ